MGALGEKRVCPVGNTQPESPTTFTPKETALTLNNNTTTLPLTTPSSSSQLPSCLLEERRCEPLLRPWHLLLGSLGTPALLSPVLIFSHGSPSADCQCGPHLFGGPSFCGHVFILLSDVPSLFFAGKSGFTRSSPLNFLGAGPKAVPFLISITVIHNSPNPSFTLQPE